jgi:hypothetical protein
VVQRSKRRGKRVLNRRDAYLRKKYGISGKEYRALERLSGGACWICGTVPRTTLNVDHDHKVAKTEGVRRSIRGLLCFMCNKHLIGRRRREHAHLFVAAARYLISNRAQEVLQCSKRSRQVSRQVSRGSSRS